MTPPSFSDDPSISLANQRPFSAAPKANAERLEVPRCRDRKVDQRDLRDLFGRSVLNGRLPYPSIADLGFGVSMLMLIAEVAIGIRSWLTLGFFEGDGRKRVAGSTFTARNDAFT
jgi:hypothetical protein